MLCGKTRRFGKFVLTHLAVTVPPFRFIETLVLSSREGGISNGQRFKEPTERTLTISNQKEDFEDINLGVTGAVLLSAFLPKYRWGFSLRTLLLLT